MHGKRIILASLGSSGDLNPYLAIASGLKDRGHSTAVGGYSSLRAAVEDAGVEFFRLRPNGYPPINPMAATKELLHPVWEEVRLRSRMILPNVRATFEDLSVAVRDADVFITSPLVLPAALVAAKTGIPWIPAFHMITGFISLAEHVAANLLPAYGRNTAINALARPLVANLLKPIMPSDQHYLAALWRENGFVYDRRLMPHEQFPARLILGLLSPTFVPSQPNAHPHTRVTGFPFYDPNLSAASDQEALEEFLDHPEPPVLFTLGSTKHLGNFFLVSLEAAVRLKRRAVFLIGNHSRRVLPDLLPKGILVVGQVPFSKVFPRGAAIVHHGGIGTTALALRAGRPMLVVPRSFDQPDNAVRAERLGTGRVLPRSEYSPATATAELGRILRDDGYRIRAGRFASSLQTENGTGEACDAIEEFIGC